MLIVIISSVSMNQVKGSVSFESLPDMDCPDALPDDVQKKENEANEKYQALLTSWGIINPDDEISEKLFPSFFGGVYLDEKKRLVIELTSLEGDYKDYFSSIINVDDVVFESVEYSYSFLKTKRRELIKQVNESENLKKMITGIGLSNMNNSVVIYTTSKDEELYNCLKSDTDDSKKPFYTIKIVEGRDTPALAVTPGSYLGAYYDYRSMAFWAKKPNGDLGVVTAPHESVFYGEYFFSEGYYFGTAETPYFGGSVDAVFVKRDPYNVNHSASRYVTGWGFELASNTYVSLIEGSTTYSRGYNSGCKLGTIQDTDYYSPYDQNHSVDHCVITSAICNPGDSGGLVAGSGNSNTRYVTGIISGRHALTGYIIYTKVGYALSAMGVSIY